MGSSRNNGKRKILIITKWFPSEGTTSASPFVYSLTKEVSRYFNDVYVISLNPSIPAFLRRKALLKRIGYDRRWHEDIYSKAYFRPYTMENIHVHYVKYSDIVSKISVERECERVKKRILSYMEKEGIIPDIIHAHFLFPGGYIASMLKKDLAIPLVISGHGSDVYSTPFKIPQIMPYTRKAVTSADHIITPSLRNKDVLVKKLGAEEKKVSVIPNGYDENIFKAKDMREARKILKIPPDKKVLVSVGNLIPVKGYDILLDALSMLKKSEYLCYIIGDGKMREELEEKANKQGIGDMVVFTGSVMHEEIPLWINAADVFVISSRDEGNPTVLFEAWGCGRPVVAASVGGIPDVFKETLGVLVKANDPKSLAEGIIRAMKTRWDNREISLAARDFSWKNIGKKQNEIYDLYISQLT